MIQTIWKREKKKFWEQYLIHCFTMSKHIFTCTLISINTYVVNSWRKSIFQCSKDIHPNSISAKLWGWMYFSFFFFFFPLGQWCFHGSLVCFHYSKVPKCPLMCAGPFLPRTTFWLKWNLFVFFFFLNLRQIKFRAILKEHWNHLR